MPSSKIKQNWTAAKLRQLWLDYFQKKQHSIVPSASLLPTEDPTLLFTSAGMVPFKAYFSGYQTPPWPRAVSIQKCLRTTDLDSVGKTERHCSFFEMLGNFSFGDYFKREAIAYAWEFSTKHLGFPKDKIYITVFQNDEESEGIWHEEIGIPLERIKRLDETDNWWGPVGEQGPCGPCSELYFDRGASICENCFCSDKTKCAPGGEGERFMEYWNLVFNEFYRDAKGKDTPLPQKGVDTGAGLERILALLENQESIYETAEIRELIEHIVGELAPQLRKDKQKLSYATADKTTKTALRVLCDHARAASFSIADGIYPSNTGRGYVVRRIIRRALLYARELEIYQPLLHHLVTPLSQAYAKYYPELLERKSEIKKYIQREEERFLETLELGLGKWQELLQGHQQRKAKIFSGEAAFLLYDTYGFPFELTLELASKAALPVDQDLFNAEMATQRKRSSVATKASLASTTKLPNLSLPPNHFLGYEENTSPAQVIAIIQNDKEHSRCETGTPALIILNQTPFYAEGGGQLGDTGTLQDKTGLLFQVQDTQKQGDLILHIGVLQAGVLEKDSEVTANINEGRRKALAQHHSATHLLNQALRKTLGQHVTQTGSLVAPDHLRFDFAHTTKISEKDLATINKQVNQAIAAGVSVSAEVMPIIEAQKLGAVATFGEKYGEEVRILRMGEKGKYSLEFCGGCHVANTAEIAFFYITKETSPGAGNRRIEALAGQQVVDYFENKFMEWQKKIIEHNQELDALVSQKSHASKVLTELSSLYIKIKPTWEPPSQATQDIIVESWVHTLQEAESQVSHAVKKKHKLLKELGRSSNQQSLKESAQQSLKAVKKIGKLQIICQEVLDQKTNKANTQDPAYARQLADEIKEQSRGIVILLGMRQSKGAHLLFSADKPALQTGLDMRLLINNVAEHIGGKGGGRPDMAQAGGKNADGLVAALEAAQNIVIKTIEQQ